MIGIIDYGMGNLFSVSKALERLQAPYVVSGDVSELKGASGFILPGVGSFKDAMSLLNEQQLTPFIKEQVKEGKPLLGICLGMQLLFDESEENGRTEGLGLLSGRIEPIPPNDVKVPHMGWNKLTFHHEHSLIDSLQPDYAYFVHSYYAVCDDFSIVLASADYGVQVPAIVGVGNVMGTQFHPEKSSELGIKLLKNYIRLVEGAK